MDDPSNASAVTEKGSIMLGVVTMGGPFTQPGPDGATVQQRPLNVRDTLNEQRVPAGSRDVARALKGRPPPSQRRFSSLLPPWVTLTALVLAICGTTLLSLAFSVRTVAGTPRMIGPSGDDNFPTVNAVSGTPAEWISAVCEPVVRHWHTPIVSLPGADDVSLYPNVRFALPGATFSAQCPARHGAASGTDLLIARFPSEDAMQLDLARTGFEWYCFAANQGSLFVIATGEKESVAGSNGFGVSPLLDPMTRYGFNVYRDPGP